MKDSLAKIIRTITIAPIMALILLVIIYIYRPLVFGSTLSFVLAIILLVLFPISAYPLQPLIPGFKSAGRDGQRNLAIIMANVGYILGIFSILFTGFNKELLIVYLTYLLSGVLIFVINKCTKVRASGHACGVTGPMAILVYFFGPPALYGLAVLVLTYWSSLITKRHTNIEFLMGSIIPVVALLLAISCTKLV